MKLYFAGSVHKEVTNYLINNNFYCLRSYVNEKTELEYFFKQKQNNKFNLFMDSGAFSAWTKGKNINITNYIDFINNNTDYLDLFTQFDTLPGSVKSPLISAKLSWENFLYMRKLVKEKNKLVFTFHVGEPLEYLKEALKYRDDYGNLKYIAFGGMVGKSKNIKYNFLNNCFNIIKESKAIVKTHGFGLFDLSLLKQFPLTSVDTTGYLKQGAFGNILYKNNFILISKETINNKQNFKYYPEILKENIRLYVQESGFTVKQLMEFPKYRIMYNIWEYNKLISNLTPVFNQKNKLF